jgi:paraquat-inducible protein A
MTITCADCGSTQIVPPLPPRAIARCHRCGRVLDRRRWTRSDVSLASAVATFILLPPAVMLPLMESTIRNLVYERSRLVSSVPEIYREVWFPFAFGFLFVAFLFPALRALFQIIVLGSIRWDWKIPQRGRIFRWSEELRIWSMTDVVAIAGIIAYYRAAIPADVAILLGAWVYLAVAVVALIADRAMDRRAVWNAILPDRATLPGRPVVSCGICEMAVSDHQRGRPCPRCGAALDPDIARRFAPAAAAITATLPLCFPAFSFAVIVNDRLTGVWEHTIIGTVQLLADQGYWQFGLVLLLAGVVIPLAAVLVMAWLLMTVRFPTRRGLVMRTRAYRALRRLVRWPMIIPFIAAIAAPIVDFRHIDDIVAGPGATPFFALIVLIMLAVRLFEPRLMWKNAGEAP